MDAGNKAQVFGTSHHSHKPAQTNLPANLSGLPTYVCLKILERVLVAPQPVHLFKDGGSGVEAFAPGRPVWWTALLRVSRHMHSLARQVLYGANRFIIVDVKPQRADLLESFLNSIGRRNAALLTHICINYPAVTLGGDGRRSLKLLQEQCPRLTTLELYVYDACGGILTNPEGASTQDDIRTTLKLVQEPLQSMETLKVVVRAYVPTLSPVVVTSMEEMGWEVKYGDR